MSKRFAISLSDKLSNDIRPNELVVDKTSGEISILQNDALLSFSSISRHNFHVQHITNLANRAKLTGDIAELRKSNTKYPVGNTINTPLLDSPVNLGKITHIGLYPDMDILSIDTDNNVIPYDITNVECEISLSIPGEEITRNISIQNTSNSIFEVKELFPSVTGEEEVTLKQLQVRTKTDSANPHISNLHSLLIFYR